MTTFVQTPLKKHEEGQSEILPFVLRGLSTDKQFDFHVFLGGFCMCMSICPSASTKTANK